jgi:hypothetical protein
MEDVVGEYLAVKDVIVRSYGNSCSPHFALHRLPAAPLSSPQLLVVPVAQTTASSRPAALQAALHAFGCCALRLWLAEAGVSAAERAELRARSREAGGWGCESAATVGTGGGCRVSGHQAGARAVVFTSGPHGAAAVSTEHHSSSFGAPLQVALLKPAVRSLLSGRRLAIWEEGVSHNL